MNKYSVRISFRGEDAYVVEAENEEEAQDKACEECEWANPGIDSMEPGNAKLVQEKS